MAAFDTLGLMPELCQAIEEVGWILPTDVQDEAIPLILGGGDVMIAAETGSGKTGAFALPLLQIVYETLRGKGQSEIKVEDAPALSFSDTIKMNVYDRDPFVAISPEGLQCQARNQQSWGGCRATRGVTKGKYYFEAQVTDEGLCRVGFATASSSRELGMDGLSWGFGGTGKKSCNRVFEDYGEAFGLNDVIGCMLDRDNHIISFSKNGKQFGAAFVISKELWQTALFPAVALKNAEIKFDFSPSSTPPGYKPFSQSSAADSTLFVPSNSSHTHRSASAATSSHSVGDIQRLPLALILEPTRELAEQVHAEISKFKTYLTAPSISHSLFIGGVSTDKMAAALRNGVNIVVGTPGRLMDFLKSGALNLSEIRYLVLDEADRLVQDGGIKDILLIHSKLNRAKGVQVIVCSATLHSPEISQLAEKITLHPQWVDLKGKDAVPDTVDHAIVQVHPKDISFSSLWDQTAQFTDAVHARDLVGPSVNSPESLSEGIKRSKVLVVKKLIDAFKMEQCMIFCRTQIDCDNLEAFLVQCGGGRKYAGKAEKGLENPYSCVVLHSGRPQNERKSNLEAFKEGAVRFLICTDVAARGLDISELPYVINMTLPAESEDYIHRIGRVGRAEAIGLAISVVSVTKEKVWFHKCNRPDRGRGCTRTDLVEHGGCTIWYDEPLLMKDIEKRLGGVKLSHLDPQNLIKGREEFIKRAAAGQLKDDPFSEETNAHIASLQPAVQELAALEMQVQINYLKFKFSHSRNIP